MAMVAMPTTAAFTSTEAADPSALVRRARDDGYCFLPRLLPEEAVDELRRAMTRHLIDEGWCDDADLRARPGLGHPVFEDHERFMRLYRRCYRERIFHALPHHPRLLAALAAIVGKPVLVQPRHILRVQTPGSGRWSTPPHQDCFYIGGTLDTWTAWIPLTDCPHELGGLAVQAGSHHRGPLPVQRADGAGGHGVAVDEAPWHCGDFAVGDVLLMHSCCVHQALDNDTPDRLRLSVDLRYQNAREPVHPSSLQPHIGVHESWASVYAGWPADDPLRHYWRDLHLDIREERSW